MAELSYEAIDRLIAENTRLITALAQAEEGEDL